MQIMALIPWLDIFLSLVFLGLVVLGFWQGLLREVWFLLSLYLAAVLASLYGDFVARLVGARVSEVGSSGEGGAVSSALGFFVVFALAVVILYAILASLFGHLRLRASLLWLDKTGGIVLGLLTSFVVTSFIAYVLNAILQWPGPKEWLFLGVLQSQRGTAPVLQALVTTRPVLLALIRPWLPAGLPAFLR